MIEHLDDSDHKHGLLVSFDKQIVLNTWVYKVWWNYWFSIPELVKKALLGVAKSLEVVNLNDIIYPTLPVVLWSWHEKYKDFATFPWVLLGFASDSHFFSTHLNVIVPVLIHRRDNTYLQRLGAVLGQSVPDIIEVCIHSSIFVSFTFSKMLIKVLLIQIYVVSYAKWGMFILNLNPLLSNQFCTLQ